MRLTSNLSRHEFECECGCGFDVVDYELIRLMQDAADYFKGLYNASKVFITITGPNRCASRNTEIGGAENSQHVFGKAADHHIDVIKDDSHIEIPSTELAGYYEGRHPDRLGIGIYSGGRVHLDSRDYKARWDQR